MLDARPFEDLHHIVQDFHDDRIWVFAEWVSAARRSGLGRSLSCRCHWVMAPLLWHAAVFPGCR